MKFLILAAVVACAAAAPSVVPLAYSAPLVAPLAPTVAPGDVQAAAIDASVKATDVAQHVYDQTNEAHGEAVAAAEEKTWEAVDAVKSAQAEIDGAAAAASPTYAKAIAYNGAIAPVAAVAPYAAVAPVAPIAPVAPYVGSVLPGIAPYSAGYYGYNAPLVRAW